MTNKKPENIALKITAIYLTCGTLWILSSDKVLSFLVSDKEMITFFSMIKGWVYVFVTGILIYYLINTSLRKLKTTELELMQSCNNYSEANKKLETTIRALKEYEHKLQYLACYDQLTDIRNRTSLNDKLRTLINPDSQNKCAILYIDVDNFKYINATMGHRFGDMLLVTLSERLFELNLEDSSVYRIGGDEFVVLVEKFDRKDQLEKIAVNILKAFKPHFEVEGVSIYSTVSIGVSIYPEHGKEIDTLLKNADIAVYKAKESGKNRIVFYNAH